MEKGPEFFGQLENRLAEAYQRYSESLPIESDIDTEVEIECFYPELNAAEYTCIAGDEKTELHVFAEEKDDYVLASFLREDHETDLRFLNVLQILEEVSSPTERRGENGETFIYEIS